MQKTVIQNLSHVIALFGAVVFVLGLVWPMLSTGADEWSPDQQAEYSTASRGLHSSVSRGHQEHEHAGHNHDHHEDATVEDYEQAKERFATISQQLQVARQGPRILGKRLKLAGATLLVVGFVAMLFAKPT